MVIRYIRFYTGDKLPDPLYNNVLYYPDMAEPGEDPKSETARIIESLAGVTTTLYSANQENTTVYCLAETPTTLSIVIPATEIDVANVPYVSTWEPPAVPLAKYKPTFWFVDNVTITSQGKVRLDLVRDEWSNDWPKYVNVPVRFSRRHTQRWKARTGVTGYEAIYNGLSDPDAEALIFSKTHDEPLDVFGRGTVTVGTEDCPAVIVWRYIRFSTTKFWVWEDNQYNLWDAPNAIPLKENVPTVAYPIGICYRKANSTKTFFRKFEYINDGFANVALDFAEIMALSNAYVADSFVTTRPPCPFTFDIYTVDNTPYLRAKADTTTGNPVPEVFSDVKCGGDTAAGSVALPAGMVYTVSTAGSSTIVPSYSYNIEFSPDYAVTPSGDPKLSESPYSTRRLKIGTADVDISPAPGRGTIGVDIPYLLGTSAIITGDGKEIAEIPAWWTGLHTDTISDALQDWLITNRNTYEQGKNWQIVNSLFGIGKGLMAENYGAVAGSAMSGAQQYVMNAARIMDLANTPGRVSIPSGDAFDNLPYFDHPVVSYTQTDATSRAKITAFWARYGYPDNTTAAISDAMTRTRFVYMRGNVERYVPGVLNVRQSWFGLAMSRGLYVWRLYKTNPGDTTIQCALNSAADVANITNNDDV